MTFEFQLLSLLLIFLLVMFHYSKDDNNSYTSRIYQSIVLLTHLMQIVSIIVYIGIKNQSNIEIFSRVYFAMLIGWFSLYCFYYFLTMLKSKYANNKTKMSQFVTNNIKYFILVQVITTITILMFKAGNNIYDLNGVTSLFMGIYVLVEALILAIGYRKINKKFDYSLVFMLLIQLLSIYFQGRSPELPLLNIGIILTIYLNYFTLENSALACERNIILEKNYAKKQSIDKTNFLRVLSREIRIPLNTIDGFSQVIEESDDLNDIKSDIEDIRVASRELIDVINGMIDLSIIESGNLEVISENYNVYDMIDNIKSITESKLREKKLDFKMEIDDDIPEILLGDSERLSQVIMNLLTNAIKYTNKGAITLKIDSVKSNTKCRLKIVVSDTGVGIKKEDLNTIFEGKSQKDGAGLGLVVSKYILDQMGGSIEVESTYGAGSKFIITLDQKIISNSREEKVLRKRALKPFKATGKRIILVDDNKLNLKVATKLLSLYDVEIVEATSGKECLEILDKDNEFDLILMDDMMPEMSGTECLSILKKIERVDGFYIPVVVLTANAVSGMKDKYLKAGFEDYLSKPIDKYELDRILKKYIKK